MTTQEEIHDTADRERIAEGNGFYDIEDDTICGSCGCDLPEDREMFCQRCE